MDTQDAVQGQLTPYRLQPWPRGYTRYPAKNACHCAYRLASERDDLTLVRGYARTELGVWAGHWWCVDRSRGVVDPYWENEATAYVGTETLDVVEVARQHGHYWELGLDKFAPPEIRETLERAALEGAPVEYEINFPGLQAKRARDDLHRAFFTGLAPLAWGLWKGNISAATRNELREQGVDRQELERLATMDRAQLDRKELERLHVLDIAKAEAEFAVRSLAGYGCWNDRIAAAEALMARGFDIKFDPEDGHPSFEFHGSPAEALKVARAEAVAMRRQQPRAGLLAVRAQQVRPRRGRAPRLRIVTRRRVRDRPPGSSDDPDLPPSSRLEPALWRGPTAGAVA